MARVSATRSSSVMPRKKTAMAKAAAWPSLTAPLVRPAMNSPISPALKRLSVALGADDLLRQNHAPGGR